MLKCLQATSHGFDSTFANFGLGGMASVFQMMEIAHTHYWSKDINDSSDISASLLSSQSVSPYGSRENLRSPQSPNNDGSLECLQSGISRKNSMVEPSPTHHRRLSTNETSETQSTTEMFKEMLTQKRNMLLNKLTSVDSDVS